MNATPLPTRSVTSALTRAFEPFSGTEHPDPATVLDAALGGIRRVDLDEHVLLQFGEPFVRPGFFAAAFVFHEGVLRSG